MRFNILFLCALLKLVYGFHTVKTFDFLKKKFIYPEITNILTSELDNKPIILNGVNTILKRDLCIFISRENNFKFKEYSFDEFIINLPYKDYTQTLFFVNDFLVGNGRILNHYEQEKILNIPHTNNVIILQTNNIERIPIKDNEIIRNFKILEFPKLFKKDLIKYINDTITINYYDNDMYLLNWYSYDIEKLDFEDINILLFEINNMFLSGKNIKEVTTNIAILVESFNNMNLFRSKNMLW